jgi:outer membrane protein TolC
MIDEGVATKADGLKVDVKVNEAEMKITQVEDGLSLAKMLLCQLCGLPLTEEIVLEDESKNDIVAPMVSDEMPDVNAAETRPELRMLQNAVDLSKQATNLIRAAYLPHVALTGGYMISNPNVFNGFQRKFAGNWTVGVIVHVPVWNWFEGTYKVRASKVATTMAQLELSDANEKINLQISQSQFKVKEARKKLIMAKKNIKSAEENLRCATLGFKEGVIESTDVMAAQTAWQQAMSQKIDAEVDVRMSLINLKKAIGVLN